VAAGAAGAAMVALLRAAIVDEGMLSRWKGYVVWYKKRSGLRRILK
jgi:hypothetical protein